MGTLSVAVVKAMTCGSRVAIVTVVNRRVYVGIARSSHVWSGLVRRHAVLCMIKVCVVRGGHRRAPTTEYNWLDVAVAALC